MWIIAFGMPPSAHGALFGVSGEYVKNKITEITAKVADEINGIKGDVSGEKGDISGVKSNIGTLEMRIGSIEQKVNAQGTAVAGFQNKINQTNADLKGGRDANMNSGNTMNNDSKVMVELIASYKSTIKILVIQLCALMLGMVKIYRDMFISSEKSESTLDTEQMKLIRDMAIKGEKKNDDK
jgi:hypothetical protein